ncbi:MAG: sigma-70 family RNA polymerase sigma factor [Ruminococcaceae bacterium]|nr:sigma-70 family RNA polymerase sigma factor [Oscillospiraceae bacterium]
MLEKYKYLVRSVTAPYFLAGGDRDDLLQEGMIGLYNGIHCFKGDKGIEFVQFARYCIKRNVITAVRAANRQKHQPLNSYVSIWGEDGNETDEDLPLVPDPEVAVIEAESVQILDEGLKSCLSKMEYKVLVMFLEGKSYVEIAEGINKNIKSVDNALQRIRNKIKGAGLLCQDRKTNN